MSDELKKYEREITEIKKEILDKKALKKIEEKYLIHKDEYLYWIDLLNQKSRETKKEC